MPCRERKVRYVLCAILQNIKGHDRHRNLECSDVALCDARELNATLQYLEADGLAHLIQRDNSPV